MLEHLVRRTPIGLMRHLRASERKIAVDVWYLGPGSVREYRMVRTSAEFWTARKPRQPYRKALLLLKVIAKAVGDISSHSEC